MEHFRGTLCLSFKTSPRENEFDLHENKRVGARPFHMNGFTETRFEIEAKVNACAMIENIGHSVINYFRGNFTKYLTQVKS